MRRALLATALLPLASCLSSRPSAPPVSTRFEGGISELEIQSLVMEMADEYDAALGETIYLALRDEAVGPKGRWLAMSFLRNGMGAALDIAAGPNPDVALLDLLVLGSLQTWALENQWTRAGLDPEVCAPAIERLKKGEAELWAAARRVLSQEQEATLRQLIATWIDEHPDRTVVSFVRFDDFTDERQLSTASSRGRAAGLLADVSDATAAVEDARLFGERALWYAGRLPYVVGQQAELTAYRLADQPEVEELWSALPALKQLSTDVSARLASLESIQRDFFEQFGEERARAVESARAALEAVVAKGVELASARADEQRERLLGALDATESDLRGVLVEGNSTAATCRDAAQSILAAAEAADRLAARFDRDPAEEREPLQLADLRLTANAANEAADKLTALFDRMDAMLASGTWDERVAAADAEARSMANALFWRGAALVLLLVGGLALVRLVPARGR